MNTNSADIQYHRDGNRWVASLIRGSKGFFVHTAGETDWSYVAPGSLRWDSLHQNLYRTFHDYESCLHGEEQGLPPLPPLPDVKNIPWENNFLPKHELSAADFPGVAAHLQASHDKKMQMWIVLEEDQYETRLGDGCFRYFEGKVYCTKADAEFAAGTPHNGYTNTVATIVIGIDGIAIVPCLFAPKLFEHYRFEEVVKAAEGSIDIFLQVL